MKTLPQRSLLSTALVVAMVAVVAATIPSRAGDSAGERPGKDKESNWLPAPNGPFMAVLRLYWPKEQASNGKWKQPRLKRME